MGIRMPRRRRISIAPSIASEEVAELATRESIENAARQR
jgi:hypothetical protein